MSQICEGDIILRGPYASCVWIRKIESDRCYGFVLKTGAVINFPVRDVRKVLGNMKNLSTLLEEKTKC